MLDNIFVTIHQKRILRHVRQVNGCRFAFISSFVVCIYVQCFFVIVRNRLFIKPETQGRGMKCRECRERNVDQDSRESLRGFRGTFSFQNSSRECSRRFQGMFQMIPGNVAKVSGKCSRRFWGILGNIRGNVQEDSRGCFQFQINQSHILLKKSKC